MKKQRKFLAFLLVLCMVFTILPLSTLAAESGESTAEPAEQLSADASRGLSPLAGPYSSVPLNLTVSSYAAPFLNGSTGEHSVKTYKMTKYISRSTACGTGTNASGSAKARFVGSNEAGWSLVIDVVVGNYSETWTTNARITNKDMSKATGEITFGMSWNSQGGVSTTIRISGATNLPTPAPNAPTDAQVQTLLSGNAVKIDCINSEVTHADKIYGLIAGTYSIGSVQGDSSRGYTCAVTVNNPAPYVSRYNTDTAAEHTLSPENQGSKTITLEYKNSAWSVKSGTAPVTYTVICQTEKYTVTYNDGEANGASFADQVYSNLLPGTATPAFTGGVNGKPVWTDHVFIGWEPSVDDTVTETVTYVAMWADDKNNNGIPDDEEDKLTVTYNDGEANGASFTDQVHSNLLPGTATPAFTGGVDGKPVWTDHVFVGWEPSVADTVTESVTYVAMWADDKNNNGIPDNQEETFTVTYTDGVEKEEVFKDQIYSGLLEGDLTPAFSGNIPTRKGYTFAGWKPAIAEKVTGNTTYVAQWKALDAVQTGDSSSLTMWIALLGIAGLGLIAAAAVVVLSKKQRSR